MPRKQKIRWPRRPPRLSRLFDNAPPLYFVTFNCYKRRHLLAHPEVHEAFRTFCFKAQEHAIAVGRYVIMPEHIHLFVAFPRVGITLPSWVGSLRNVIGKLRGRESYSQKWNYVRMNPVRAKLCEMPETWPYQGEIVWLPFD